MPPSRAASAPAMAPASAPSSPAAPSPISAPTVAPNSIVSSWLRSLCSIIVITPSSSLRTTPMSIRRITSRSRRSASTEAISPLNSPPANPPVKNCTGARVMLVSWVRRGPPLRAEQLRFCLLELLRAEYSLVHQALQVHQLRREVIARGSRWRRGDWSRRRRRRGLRRRSCLLRLEVGDALLLAGRLGLVVGDVLARHIRAPTNHRRPHQRSSSTHGPPPQRSSLTRRQTIDHPVCVNVAAVGVLLRYAAVGNALLGGLRRRRRDRR